MLGSQFDRTYWQDQETGKTSYYGPHAHDTPYGSAIHDPQGQVGEWPHPLRRRGGHDDIPHQGMLFHPATGTGTVGDPLAGDSAPLIRKALRLEDKDQYDKRARSHGTPDHAAASSGAVAALQRTSMPPHVLDKINASVTVSPHEGRSHATGNSITIMGEWGQPDWPALTHELGHTLHGRDALDQQSDWVKGPNEHGGYQGMAGRPDPRSEGIADGISDRFTRLASAHADLPSLHERTGYTTQFSGFRDKTGRALYSAARAHASMSDLGATDVPSREELMRTAGLYTPGHQDVSVSIKSGRSLRSTRKYTDVNRSKVIADSSANSLLLGHLAHHNPAIVPHLEAQGFGKVTQQAVGMYHQHFPQHAPAPVSAPSAPEHEQLTLDLGNPKRKGR